MALTLANADVIGRFTQIADHYFKADSGSTTTVVSKSVADELDLANYYVCFLSGDNKGIDRVVSSYDDVTGTLTFSELDTAIDNTVSVAVSQNGFNNFIDEAELSIGNYLRNNGYDVDNFLTPSQLREAHLYKTIELICRSRYNDGSDDDLYFKNMELYGSLFTGEMARLVADYDANEDGSISTDEELLNIGQVMFVR